MKELIQQYQRYIERVAFNLDSTKKHFDDLVQCGIIGLYRANENYDESKGTFHKFAIFYIRGAMLNYLNDNSRTIRIPQSQLNPNRKTIDDLPISISIETPIGEESKIEDTLASEEEDDSLDDEQEALRARLRQALSEMKPDYQKIIWMREIEEMSFVDIAKVFNITNQAIQKKYNSAMKILRKKLT